MTIPARRENSQTAPGYSVIDLSDGNETWVGLLGGENASETAHPGSVDKSSRIRALSGSYVPVLARLQSAALSWLASGSQLRHEHRHWESVQLFCRSANPIVLPEVCRTTSGQIGICRTRFWYLVAPGSGISREISCIFFWNLTVVVCVAPLSSWLLWDFVIFRSKCE